MRWTTIVRLAVAFLWEEPGGHAPLPDNFGCPLGCSYANTQGHKWYVHDLIVSSYQKILEVKYSWPNTGQGTS